MNNSEIIEGVSDGVVDGVNLTGNYMVEIADETGVLRKLVVTGAGVSVKKLKDGGLVLDLG